MRRVRFIGAGLCAAMLQQAALFGAAKEAEYAPAPQQAILSTDLGAKDLEFLTAAGPQIALLVRLCALAQEHAVTPEVKAEAAAALKGQTEAAAKLKELAASVHVPVAEEPDDAGQQVLARLGKLKGVRFDKGFLDAQSDADGQLEASLQAGAGSDEGGIKAFANGESETLKQERERVRKLGM